MNLNRIMRLSRINLSIELYMLAISSNLDHFKMTSGLSLGISIAGEDLSTIENTFISSSSLLEGTVSVMTRSRRKGNLVIATKLQRSSRVTCGHRCSKSLWSYRDVAEEVILKLGMYSNGWAKTLASVVRSYTQNTISGREITTLMLTNRYLSTNLYFLINLGSFRYHLRHPRNVPQIHGKTSKYARKTILLRFLGYHA